MNNLFISFPTQITIPTTTKPIIRLSKYNKWAPYELGSTCYIVIRKIITAWTVPLDKSRKTVHPVLATSG
jgi:hypothetical protein